MTLYRVLGCLLLVIALSTVGQAQDIFSWFKGGKASATVSAPAAKKEPPKTAVTSARATEIFVELAWMADPATFPYFLEAHVVGNGVEVRGFVPDAAVRDKAIVIARFQSSMTVIDALKEHPGLLVQPAIVAQNVLTAQVQSALKGALPKGYSRLDIHCTDKGEVKISGPVAGLEEKLLVSQVLRRQRGCQFVTNATLAIDPVFIPNDAEVVPVVATPKVVAPDVEADSKEPAGFSFMGLFRKTPEKAPPAAAKKVNEVKPIAGKEKAGEATLPVIRTVNDASSKGSNSNVESAASKGDVTLPKLAPAIAPQLNVDPPPPAKKQSIKGLKKAIEDAIPAARPVQITETAKGELKVEIHSRTSSASSQLAGQILSLPALQTYHVELHIHVDEPDGKSDLVKD